MILSVSRRQDIPGLDMDRYINYQNTHSDIDCTVFWTKTADQLLSRLGEITVPFYTLFTLVYYPKRIHTNLPDIKHLISNFKELSEATGGRVMWRYDPVVLAKELPVSFHKEAFSRLVDHIGKYTSRCIISLYVHYGFADTKLRSAGINVVTSTDMIGELCDHMLHECGDTIEVRSCSTPMLEYGIEPNKCIDDEYITTVLGVDVPSIKDPTQRKLCGCIASTDIGVYNVCKYQCAYCYASRSDRG
jgi:hypothetical protein